MVDIKAAGLLAMVVAAWPAAAVAQNAGAAERAAARLKEADRLEGQGMKSAGAGNYASAAIPLEAALMIRESVQGPDHADTARLMNNYGMVCLTLGRPKEAEALLNRALASREKALGPAHPDVADILHNLANTYAASDDVARIEGAPPLLERAAAIRAHALGAEHPRVAEALNAMAGIDLQLARRAGSWNLLSGMRGGGRPRLSRDAYLDRARRGFEGALAIREKALGPGHPAVASSLRNLAAVQAERGHFTEAEPLMRRAVAIAEKTPGPDHPATADLLDEYASILANARHDDASVAEARALKTRARAIRDGQVRRASAGPAPESAPPR